MSLKGKKQFVSPQPALKTARVHPLAPPPPSAMTSEPAEEEQPVSMAQPRVQGQRGLRRPPERWVGDLHTKGSMDRPPPPWPSLTHNGRTFRSRTQPAPAISQRHPEMQLSSVPEPAPSLLRSTPVRRWGGERTERQVPLPSFLAVLTSLHVLLRSPAWHPPLSSRSVPALPLL